MEQPGESLGRERPAVVAGQRQPAAPKAPHALTSSLCPSSRCCHSGRSRRDCPPGRSTRERWAPRWSTRCSPAPRRPPAKPPAAGGSQCASAPPRLRGTAHPAPSPGTRLGLRTGKAVRAAENRVKNTPQHCKLYLFLFLGRAFSPS